MNIENQNNGTKNTTRIYIEAFEKEQQEGNMNFTVCSAYKTSKETNNELLNFYEIIWESDIEPIVKTCRENGINEFSISSNFSELISSLVSFEKLGCKVCGLTEANSRKYSATAKIPAIKIEVL